MAAAATVVTVVVMVMVVVWFRHPAGGTADSAATWRTGRVCSLRPCPFPAGWGGQNTRTPTGPPAAHRPTLMTRCGADRARAMYGHRAGIRDKLSSRGVPSPRRSPWSGRRNRARTRQPSGGGDGMLLL